MNRPLAPSDLGLTVAPPLDMPAQDLSRSYRDPDAPARTPTGWKIHAARAFVFATASAITATLALIVGDWFREDGISALEGIAIATVGFSFFWISLSVSTALLGLFTRSSKPSTKPARPLRTAILLPMYGEPAHIVLANARAMMEGLAAEGSFHSYALFVLSDTRDDAKAAAEALGVEAIKRALPMAEITYRRRADNIDFKSGNIREWVMRWGADFEAMLVLDADSLMSAAAIRHLADEMSRDESAGLIQSVPRLINGHSVFARMQQFSNAVYGEVLSRGLAAWSGDRANYWGHNAIIRTRAFANAAGLPSLPGRRPFGGTIQSHDFIEAALLVRAGWRVRFLPEIRHSYEEAPANVMDFVLRDRRWCQGNLQHLRLLFSAGFSQISRFHLFQGAMAYMASLGWFVLLVIWAILDIGTSGIEVGYFSPTNPLFPTWPSMDLVAKSVVMTFIYTMLLAPKLIGTLAYVFKDPTLRRLGGPVRFTVSAIAEILLSFLMAPMMMIQTTKGILRSLVGLDTGWRPKSAGTSFDWLTAIRFHWLETVLGISLLAGIEAGLLSIWLLPIAVCLVSTVFLAWIFTLAAPKNLFLTPQDVAPPVEYLRAAELSGRSAEIENRPLRLTNSDLVTA